MKKNILVLFAIILTLSLALVGCGGNGAINENDNSNNEKQLKIAYLANGSLGDKSFFESALNGVNELEKLYECKVNSIEIGLDRSKWQPALLDASEEGYDIIIIGSFDMEETIMNVAPRYPEQKYIMFDYAIDFTAGDYSNVYCMTYKGNEGAYLAGGLAALMTEKDVIGFIGGMDIPLINDFFVGFVQGAQSVNPDVKILTSYVGDFNNPAKCKELALAQYNQGADIVYQGAGQSGLGALDAAKEKGQFIISTDSDQAMIFSESDPEKANLILTSQLKRVDKTIVRAVEMFMKDELSFGSSEVLGVKEGAVELSDNEFYKKLVSQVIRDQIAEIGKGISDGTIVVDTGYGKSTEEISELRNSVKP